MFGNTGPFSYSPRGFSPEDLRNTKSFQPDDIKVAPMQRSGLSRPNGRSIYMQRKEYSESLTKIQDSFSVRVEHLFTCEMNNRDMRTVDNCVSKLKMLDAKGRLWPQEMILEIQGEFLLLSDIETKVELESIPLGSIVQTKAVLDSCAYNSLLTIMVDQRGNLQLFLFQCEVTGAELVKIDLDKAAQKHGSGQEPQREPSDIRTNLENIMSRHNFRNAGPRPAPPERTPPPPDDPTPQWSSRETSTILPYEPVMDHHDFQDLQRNHELPPSPELSDLERNRDILNHVINDLENFMDKLRASVNASSLNEDKSKKKKLLKKKKSKKTAVATLPSEQEYMSTLQKFKYGFNLLGQLDSYLTNPSAPDYVHIFFSFLNLIVSQYPAELPPVVVSPLLTDAAIGLLSGVVTPEEDDLWRFLGDAWNIPRSRWPDDSVPLYIPEFNDGWQPPAPSYYPPSFQNGPISRSNSRRFPIDPPNDMQPPGAMPRQPKSVTSNPWSPPPPTQEEASLYRRVMYNFMARNNQELSIMKGEIVEVIQKSKQWWLVRNSRNEEGNVPLNVLEPLSSESGNEDLQQYPNSPVALDMNSSPAEVKAWLECKGFSKITISSLGVLTGRLLLGMSMNEIRTVCPEDGGKVFFQLQPIKSAIALASEPSGLYNSHY